MLNSKKRKRSRSRSQNRHNRDCKTDRQIQEMQNQITNLTNTVKQLMEGAGTKPVLTLGHSDISSQSKTGERKSDGRINKQYSSVLHER